MKETTSSDLPALRELTDWPFAVSALSIAAAFLLLGWIGYRIVVQIDVWQWWVPLAFAAGMAAADFLSGLVHWGADSWGRDDCPVVGPRLLVPFRVHHINPGDFLRRTFIDTNGDPAFAVVPALLALLAVPLDTSWGAPLTVFGLSVCAAGGMTNQIHQWAHMSVPPRSILVLQSCRLLLGHQEHAAHHARPYDRHYCITTGWCNRPLEAIRFFRGLEFLITRLTGVTPRDDDRRYEMRFKLSTRDAETPLHG